MKIDWLKLKYKVKAFFIFFPHFGIRIGETDPVFDKWLWEKLKTHTPTEINAYTCRIDGREIWIANYPYGSGRLHEDWKPELYCSRATAVKLGEAVQSHFDAIKAERKLREIEEREALEAEFKVD